MKAEFSFPPDLEGKFYEFVYRAGEASLKWNRRVLAHYIPFFSGCRQVLDVGCGRGEFLELLREHGIYGVGLDIDANMVQICHEKGLEVVHADLFDYMSAQYAAFDGIFCSNVIEHMSASQALRFFQLAYQALRPGGIFLVATPNPESPIVHLYEFWRDPTHVRLYNIPLLKFMMEYVGFRDVNGGENPQTQWLPAWYPPQGHSLEVRSILGDLIRSSGDEMTTSPMDMNLTTSPIDMNWLASLDLFRIPDIPGNRSRIGRFLYALRRRLARLLVRNILFEEWAVLNEIIRSMTISLIQNQMVLNEIIRFMTKAREIYVQGRR